MNLACHLLFTLSKSKVCDITADFVLVEWTTHWSGSQRYTGYKVYSSMKM